MENPESKRICPACWKKNRALVFGQRDLADKTSKGASGYHRCVFCRSVLRPSVEVLGVEIEDVKLIMTHWGICSRPNCPKCRRIVELHKNSSDIISSESYNKSQIIATA